MTFDFTQIAWDMKIYWKFVDGKIEQTTPLEWGENMVNGQHVLKQDQIGNTGVSTIFFGFNMSRKELKEGEIPPGLFETMVFGGTMDREQWRVDTYEEAMNLHELLCRRLRDEVKENPEVSKDQAEG